MSMYWIAGTGVLGSSSQGQVLLSSIPQNFVSLQVRVTGRIVAAAVDSSTAGLQVNGDAGTNYDGHWFLGDGANPSTGRQGFYNAWFTQPVLTASNAGTGNFGTQIIDIYDYARTDKFKTIKAFGGYDNNGSGKIGLFSGVWKSNSAISSLTINVSGPFFAAGSRIDLYGTTSNSATGA